MGPFLMGTLSWALVFGLKGGGYLRKPREEPEVTPEEDLVLELHRCEDGSTYKCESGSQECVDNNPVFCNIIGGLAKPKNTSHSKPNVTILYWPQHDSSWSVYGDFDCPQSKCTITNDRSVKDHIDTRGVAWQAAQLEMEEYKQLPLSRPPWQEWILYNRESPCNYDHKLMADKVLGLFNLSATISPRSTWPIQPREMMDYERHEQPYTQAFTVKKPLPITEKNKRRTAGLAPIIYVQSHCRAETDRDNYVKELMKHMPVDSYGPCEHNKDWPKSQEMAWVKLRDDDFLDFVGQYKFSLAFENCECENYVTEKIFRPWVVGSVPVYRGSPTVDEWAPSPHSVIKADDFGSAKELASYLLKLDSNDTAYEAYLTFKQGLDNRHLTEREKKLKYGPEDMGQGLAVCKLCDELGRHRQLDETGESFTDGSRAPHIVGKSTEWMKCLPPKLEYFGRIREDNMKKYDEFASQAADSIWSMRRSRSHH